MQLMSLQSNFSSLASQLRRGSAETSKSVARLSSGNRIVNAKDDVAGMSVSATMLRHSTGLRSGLINLSQADALLQVKDAALEEVQDMLFRMNALATMANGGALTTAERGFVQIEMDELTEEIDRIFKQTTFNGVHLFTNKQVEETVTTGADIISLADVKDLEGTGNYTVQVGDEIFTGYVETYDNAASEEQENWLLIGRGREGWSFEQAGQGEREEVIEGLGSTSGFDPKAYDATTIDSLLREAGVNMNDIEIRIKRAEDRQGTNYQEARFRPDFEASQFNWNMYSTTQNFGEWEIIESSLGPAVGPFNQDWRDTYLGAGNNNYTRMFTWPWTGHLFEKGFSFGNTVRGWPGNDEFIWDNNNNGSHGIPYTEVYIRIKDGVSPPTEPGLDAFNNDPRAIDGLAAWYDAADIDADGSYEGVDEDGRTGNILNVWREKTGNGNDIIRQNGDPLLNNQINGLDAVNFANTRRGQAGDSLGGTADEMHVFFVSRDNVSGNSRLSLNGFNSNNSVIVDDNNRLWFLSRWSNGRHYLDAGRSGNHRSWVRDIYSGHEVTEVNDVTITSGFVSVAEGQNGISINGGSYTDRSATSSTVFTQGGLRVGWGAADQDMAEIIIYDRRLESDEVARVEQYLANKWRVTNFTDQGFAESRPEKPLELTLDALLENPDIINEINNRVFTNATSYQLLGGGGAFAIDEDTGQITLDDAKLLLDSTEDVINFQVRMRGEAFGEIPLDIDVEVDISDFLAEFKGGSIQFQVNSDTENQLSVNISVLSSDLLFGGELSVKTQEDAAETAEIIQEAIDLVTFHRAETGAKQSSVDIQTNAQISALINQDAARAVIADTDIAVASTAFSQQLVKNDMNITMQVQANNLRTDAVLDLLDDNFNIAPLVTT